jgi:hypothetical protein
MIRIYLGNREYLNNYNDWNYIHPGITSRIRINNVNISYDYIRHFFKLGIYILGIFESKLIYIYIINYFIIFESLFEWIICRILTTLTLMAWIPTLKAYYLSAFTLKFLLITYFFYKKFTILLFQIINL